MNWKVSLHWLPLTILFFFGSSARPWWRWDVCDALMPMRCLRCPDADEMMREKNVSQSNDEMTRWLERWIVTSPRIVGSRHDALIRFFRFPLFSLLLSSICLLYMCLSSIVYRSIVYRSIVYRLSSICLLYILSMCVLYFIDFLAFFSSRFASVFSFDSFDFFDFFDSFVFDFGSFDSFVLHEGGR